MTKRKLKPFVVPIIYTLAIILLVLSVYLIQGIISNAIFKDSNNDTQYVDDEIIDSNDYLPVISTDEEIIRPYLNTDVTIGKNYNISI